MPQIGWLEILIIVSIAIIVVGPKDFPLMLKKIGSWIGSIKRYVSDVQTQVSEITDNSIEDENSIKKSSEKKENIKDISMGMSNDYKIALQYKSDIIRVGSLIFS